MSYNKISRLPTGQTRVSLTGMSVKQLSYIQKKEAIYVKDWFKDSASQKVVALGVLVVALYLLRHVMNLILLTFIFTYLFYTIHEFVKKRTGAPSRASLFLIYGTVISGLVALGFRYTPTIVRQMGDILTQISNFKVTDYEGMFHPKLFELLVDFNVGQYVSKVGSHLLTNIAGVSGFAVQIMIAFLLSFFFILEKEKIVLFLKRFEDSSARHLFTYYKSFGRNFLDTFGKVIQVQIMIASANAVLSFFGLWIIGFPQLLGLTIMIFFLGLIPVAGVIISLVPLSIIAFNIGGIVKVVHVFVMIGVVHAMENYFLNPKLYSMKMKLPIFFTFSILIISEHLMGVWGLLLGIPLFMFMLDVLKVPNQPKTK